MLGYGFAKLAFEISMYSIVISIFAVVIAILSVLIKDEERGNKDDKDY